MRIPVLFLTLFTLLLVACASHHHVMESYQPGKLFDRYFILKKKKYKYYTQLIFNISHMRGRYVISHDTIYLLTKRKKLYYMDGYGVVNQDSSSIVVYGLDSLESRTFSIRYYRR
jgi:hypothetical protein